MNDSGEDRILDSFLEEMLTNQRPPDLTEQIQQRLRAELGPAAFEQLRTARLGRRAPASTPSTATKFPAAVKSRSASLSPWTSLSVAGLTLAAGLMLAFALWKLWPDGSAPDAAQLQANRAPSTEKADAGNEPKPTAPQVAVVPKAKELPLDQLPFATDTNLPELAHRPPAAAPVAAMQDAEIVQWIDERFARLWESQGIRDASALDKDRWLLEVANRLSGRSDVPATAESPQALSQELVRTATFAELFADRIATVWLKGSGEATENAAGSQLRRYLAEQIVAKKPWNEVLSSLVSSAPDQPQAVWLAAFAGGGNHRLAGRIGSIMLDEALACARCHDASDNGRIVSMDQDDYWSLVAIFSGIDGRVTKADEAPTPRRQLVDNQKQLFEGAKSPSVYFDRPDGRVQAARYRLPGGDDWRTIEDVQTPRESLARWIDRSSITDQASVNLAWRIVFGRPLVAQHAALDGEGYLQRREILSMLAEQFQAHNRDLGQLVTWLVSSRPFARDTLAIDRSRWLTASDDEILQWRTAAANFAVRLPEPSGDKTFGSLDAALWHASIAGRARPIVVRPWRSQIRNYLPNRDCPSNRRIANRLPGSWSTRSSPTMRRVCLSIAWSRAS